MQRLKTGEIITSELLIMNYGPKHIGFHNLKFLKALGHKRWYCRKNS